MPSVLFVCLGNICRSPLAEAVFRAVCNEHLLMDIRIESCGTGNWHAGEGADPRMRQTARRHGLCLEKHVARQIRTSDFAEFDLLVVMDLKNERDLLALGAPREKLFLLRDFDREDVGREVPDPYFGGDEGFEHVFRMVTRCAEVLFEERIAVQEKSDI